MQSIGILIPTLKKGGAEKQAVLLARALSEIYDVTLIVVHAEAGFERELIDLSALDRSKIVSLGGFRQWSLYKTLRSNKFDTLFCYLTWPDFYGVIAGRIAGVKHIYQGLRSANLPWAKLWFEWIGNKFATGVVTNNYSGAEIFTRRGIKRQTVIPNCYLNPRAVTVRPERDTVTVITVGRFVPQKDYLTAIKAMTIVLQENPKTRFKIIGHGELEQDVRAWIAQSDDADRMEVLINPSGIMNHLLDADIYLSTSIFEGTSNSIMEAMDASLPIVTTDAGDNSHLVLDGQNGYVAAIGHVEHIAACVSRLVASKNLRDNMGRQGNKILRENFSFEKFRQSYIKLITENR